MATDATLGGNVFQSHTGGCIAVHVLATAINVQIYTPGTNIVK